jgi:large-conductance mechanosensitive channel
MIINRLVRSLGFTIGFSVFLTVFSTIFFGLNSFKSNLPKIIALVVLAFNIFYIFKKHSLSKEKESNFSAFREGFTELSHTIRNVVNFILLSFVYFISVGPVSLIAKLLKKSFIDVKPPRLLTDSYWKDNIITKEKIENYKRSF